MDAFGVYGMFFGLIIGGALTILVPIFCIGFFIKLFVAACKNRK